MLNWVEWAQHFCYSFFRVIMALVLAAGGAIPLGLLIGHEKKLDCLLVPFFYLTYPIPKIVFLPLIFFVLGLGEGSKIFLLTLLVSYQILITVRDRAKNIPSDLLYVAYCLGASSRNVYWEVLLPYCLPAVFTALRLALGTTIAVLFIAESFATHKGLGYLIMDAWGRGDWGEMLVGVTGMSFLGLILSLLLDWLEKKLCPGGKA